LAVIVKFLAKTSPDQKSELWTSLFPQANPVIGDIKFTFDLNAQDYDWLVVYEGLPPLINDNKINRIEPLACARKNTLLITTEPSSIRLDGPGGQYISYDTLLAQTPLPKTKVISTICSTKQMSHTVHAKRYEFVMALKQRMTDLDVFGRGINPVDEKSQAMDDYRYHIAIENHIEPGHWTEKLADSFLAFCLPFYFGDPDYAKAFPKDSVIPINIYNLDEAETIIRNSIAQNAYEKRLPAIIEARRRVLTQHNIMIEIANIVKSRDVFTPSNTQEFIYGRHIFRKKFPVKALSDAFFRIKMRKHPKASPLQFK